MNEPRTPRPAALEPHGIWTTKALETADLLAMLAAAPEEGSTDAAVCRNCGRETVVEYLDALGILCPKCVPKVTPTRTDEEGGTDGTA